MSTPLERKLFAFAKECVNSMTKDGYDLIKKLYVLEKELDESTGTPTASIHTPILPEGDEVKEFEDVLPGELNEEVNADPLTGEIIPEEKEAPPVPDDGLGDLGLLEDDLPF